MNEIKYEYICIVEFDCGYIAIFSSKNPSKDMCKIINKDVDKDRIRRVAILTCNNSDDELMSVVELTFSEELDFIPDYFRRACHAFHWRWKISKDKTNA
jgi:hypothetical protein